MTIDRFSVTACSAAAIGLVLATQPVAAQQYPSQPITIIVAAAAGGFADGVARAVGERLNEKLGQSIVIENRGGAAGNLGARAVATAKPDGHTVLVSTTAMAINGTLYKNMGYRTEDITPVAIVGSAPEVDRREPGQSGEEPAGVHRGRAAEADRIWQRRCRQRLASSRPNICSRWWPRRRPCTCRSRAARRPSPRCSATTSRPSPRRCRRWSSHIQSGQLRGIGLASAKRHPVVPDVSDLCRERNCRFLCGIVGRLLRSVADRREGRCAPQRRPQ